MNPFKKCIWPFYLLVMLLGLTIDVNAQRKATVIERDTPVYDAADFDSDVTRTVNPEESFIVSKKPYGPFYKVKFKNGALGYIVDTELNIEGIGPFQPKPFVDDVVSKNKKNKKTKKQIDNDVNEDEEDAEDQQSIQTIYRGVSLQMINFRENTLGKIRTSDLLAIGYKHQPATGGFESKISYELFVSPKAPAYYTENIVNGKVSGGIIWASTQISNMNGYTPTISIRYGAGPFLRYSLFNVKTAARNYSLQDLTVGVDIQAGVIWHAPWANLDFGLRYFWDDEPYGAVGVAILF